MVLLYEQLKNSDVGVTSLIKRPVWFNGGHIRLFATVPLGFSGSASPILAVRTNVRFDLVAPSAASVKIVSATTRA